MASEYPGYSHPSGVGGHLRLCRLVFFHPSFSPAAQRRSSRRHHRVGLRSGRCGAGGLWAGFYDKGRLHTPVHRDVDLRDSAGVVSPPVCRDLPGPESRDVAFLPQKRLRVLRRRAGTRGDRQPQKRHHQGLLSRSGGAARLRRVCRRLWLLHLTLPRTRSQEEGAREGRGQVYQA